MGNIQVEVNVDNGGGFRTYFVLDGRRIKEGDFLEVKFLGFWWKFRATLFFDGLSCLVKEVKRKIMKEGLKEDIVFGFAEQAGCKLDYRLKSHFGFSLAFDGRRKARWCLW